MRRRARKAYSYQQWKVNCYKRKRLQREITHALSQTHMEAGAFHCTQGRNKSNNNQNQYGSHFMGKLKPKHYNPIR